MSMRSRGALIVFEGCDRAGKSIQANRLIERIERKLGSSAKLIAFPDRTTPLGNLIDRYLRKEVEMDPREVHLVFAANRQARLESMKQQLQSSIHLIVDRYAYSGIAYTLAKNINGITLNWAKMADAGILKPDLIVFLDLPPEKAEIRDGFGDERFEASAFQHRVYQVMKQLINENPDVWKVVDASLPLDEVAENIWRVVEPVLHSVHNKQFSYIGMD